MLAKFVAFGVSYAQLSFLFFAQSLAVSASFFRTSVSRLVGINDVPSSGLWG